MTEKIGLAIITCNREELFRECIGNLPSADSIIVVNDGEPYKNFEYPEKISEVIQHKNNKGVGKSKNEAFKYLLNKGCEHIFIMEDDVKIIDFNVFEKYIKASEITGIKHFNYAYHGPRNKTENGEPNPVKIIDYGNEIQISLHKVSLGAAFSYYHKEVLENVGLMDERYLNCYEHVDHTYHISLAGYHPSFQWFPDIIDSFKYIKDLDPYLNNSVITKIKYLYKIRHRYNWLLYKLKNHPIKYVSLEEVLQELQAIQKKYGKKDVIMKVLQ